MAERELKPIVESYNLDEEPLYNKTYLFIKGFATGRCFNNTLRALPIARMVHNGQYRKGTIEINGLKQRVPYLLHILKVCGTLISLESLLHLSNEELDVLYAASLLHDWKEDNEEMFPTSKSEFVEKFGLHERIYDIICLLSKYEGADEYDLNVYFNSIKKDKLALLIKMADVSHNSESLYNVKNVNKNIKEIRTYILKGLSKYGKQNYPELSNVITILKSKILSLIETIETLSEKQEKIIREKDAKIQELEEKMKQIEKELFILQLQEDDGK